MLVSGNSWITWSSRSSCPVCEEACTGHPESPDKPLFGEGTVQSSHEIYAPRRIVDEEREVLLYAEHDLMTYDDAVKYGVVSPEGTEEIAEPEAVDETAEEQVEEPVPDPEPSSEELPVELDETNGEPLPDADGETEREASEEQTPESDEDTEKRSKAKGGNTARKPKANTAKKPAQDR